MSTAFDGVDGDALEPDDDTMHQFLIWWFGARGSRGCNRGFIEIGWTDGATGKLNLFKRFALNEVSQAVFHAATVNAIEGVNIYYRTATVGSTAQFTKDCDVVQIPGCWVDCDEAEAVARVLEGDGPAPSTQVITGRIPALRAQFLYKFSEPILVGDRVRTLNRRAAVAFGGDTMVINASSLMRLPGSIAWPKKLGRVPELTEWVTPDRHQDSWTLDALKAGFPPVADEEATAGPGARTAGTDDITELFNPVKALLDQVRSGPLWHEPALRLVAMLVNRGRQDCEILAMAEYLTWPDYTVAQTKDELIKMIAGARAKGFAPDDGADHPDGGAAPDVEDVMDVPPKPGPKLFPLLSHADIVGMPDPTWLIEDVLVQNSLAALYGPFRSLKSFIALDWALCMATGRDWQGKPTVRCNVLYIVGEGASGLKDRMAAWAQHNGVEGWITGFRAIPMAINMMNADEVARLILSVVAEQTANGFKPEVVIVDTLARSMVGGDENSVKDIGIVVNNLDHVRQELRGVTALLVHHAGKDVDRGSRGSSSLPGAVDTMFRATRSDMTVELYCEKQKDSLDGWSQHLKAEKVTLPLQPGTIKPRDSLVMVPGQASASGTQGSTRPKGNAAIGLSALASAVLAEGVPLPHRDGFPTTPMRGVNELAFRREFYRRLPDSTQEARQKAYTRMLTELRHSGLVGLCDGLVWSAKHETGLIGIVGRDGV